VFAGYEDARTFYQCEKCKRVWTTMAAPSPSGREPVRVLVADDSDTLVGLIAAWLEDAGYAVLTASTGRQALDVAAVHQPEIVLLDLIMPQLDGFETCAKLSRLPEPPEIILMTGTSDPQHLHRAMDLCAATLLRKPLEAEPLIAAVASAVRRRKSARRQPSKQSSLRSAPAESRDRHAEDRRQAEKTGAECREHGGAAEERIERRQ
jgi:DNA-binding response OmpR family regulator